MTGRSVGSDASRLSCFLFRPRKSCEKRRKRSHINASNASVIRTSTPPAQTAHAAKQGPSGRGRYHYPRSIPHVHEHPRAGCQNGKLCRFWVLVGGALEERRKPSEQRCAHARRCSEGVAAPLGRVIFLLLSKLRLVCPVPDTSFGSPDAPACAVPVQAASQLGPFRLGVQWFSVETGRIFCYNFGKRVT
nr:MAG TPA: hypothetical protein [Caudoviricetes sp.]